MRPLRRQKRSGDTVRFILDAAERLCNDRANFSAITIKRVADVAGVGVGTVYHHFEGRESVLRAVGKRTSMQEMNALLKQIAPLQPGHVDDFIAAAIEAIMQNAKLRIARYGNSIDAPVLQQIIFDYFESAADCIVEVIARTTANGAPSRLVVRAAVQATGMMTWVIATHDCEVRSSDEQADIARLALRYVERAARQTLA